MRAGARAPAGVGFLASGLREAGACCRVWRRVGADLRCGSDLRPSIRSPGASIPLLTVGSGDSRPFGEGEEGDERWR